MILQKLRQDIRNVGEVFRLDGAAVTIFGSARFSLDHEYCVNARNLAHRLAARNFTIITGGGGAIMESANKGATEAGGRSIGLNIFLPHEQKTNDSVNIGFMFNFMATRKAGLLGKSDYFVIFPGGFGTMDEFFEILTLHQIGHKKAKIYLFGVDFYAPLVEFFRNSLLKEGAINEAEMNCFVLSDDINEIYDDIIKTAQI